MVTFSCLGILLAYFFGVEWKPLEVVSEQGWIWLTTMDIDMGIGFAVNPINSLILITLLFVLFILSSFGMQKNQYLFLGSIVFLLTGVLSTGIIMFFISWLMLGIISFCEENEERVAKFFYTGMDILLMLFGLLLLSIVFSSGKFDAINEKFNEITHQEEGIVYLGFIILSLSIFARCSIFPFLFNYKKDAIGRDPVSYLFPFLTVIPLGYVLTLKINQAMNIPFFSNIFFAFGMLTALIILFVALTKDSAVEILNLENGSMMGMIYALSGLGQVSTSLIIFVTFVLLKSSINMLFLTMPEKKAPKKYLVPMILLTGAYVGLPGLTNFFPLFDATWVFWGEGMALLIFAFIILHGILHIKLLSTIFDFKTVFPSGPGLGRLNAKSMIALFPGVISLLIIFCSVPSNLSSSNPQILKEKISAYVGVESTPILSMQEYNIAMILLFVSVLVGILLGVYFYIVKAKQSSYLIIKMNISWINKFIDYNWGLYKIPQTLLLSEEGGYKYSLAGLETGFIYIERAGTFLKSFRVRSVDGLLLQTFVIIGFCLIIFLLGVGWEQFI